MQQGILIVLSLSALKLLRKEGISLFPSLIKAFKVTLRAFLQPLLLEGNKTVLTSLVIAFKLTL